MQLHNLSLVPCTSVYQRAASRALLSLTDASVHDVTTHCTFSSSRPEVAAVSSTGLVTASAPGLSQLGAVFSGHPTSLSLHVLPVSAAVASLIFIPALGKEETLSLPRGESVSSAVRVDFVDGSRYDDAAALSWLPLDQMVTFTSSAPAAISVSVAGILSLLDNYHVRVTISAALTCDASRQHSVEVAANLAAGYGDVDLGYPSGLMFRQTGATLPLPVYASVAGRLVNFQIEVEVDTQFVAPVFGSGVVHYSGTVVTLNSPPEVIKLVANNPQARADPC